MSVAPRPGPPGAPADASLTAVETALSRLEGLDGRPVGAHVEVFDEVHRLLQDALATLDEA